LYQEQLLEAVEALTRVKNPLYPHLYHFYLGKVYVERNRLELAREQYLKAIALQKDLVMAYLELAYVYVRLGQKAQALQLLSNYPGNNSEIKSLQQFIQKL
jgi:predicted Zn-dependent protease